MSKSELVVLEFKCGLLAEHLSRLSDHERGVFRLCFPAHHPVAPSNIDQALALCDRTFAAKAGAK